MGRQLTDALFATANKFMGRSIKEKRRREIGRDGREERASERARCPNS